MTNKKLIIIFAVIFVVFVMGAFVINSIQPEGNIAIISVNGKEVKEVDLSVEETFDLKTEYGNNTIQIKDGVISVCEADCPDKLCVRHGGLRNKYDAIVCLPNKIVIEYKNSSGEIDAVAGR